MKEQSSKKYIALSEFIHEYSERNIENKYSPVAVGKYGIRSRESIYSKELAADYSKNKLIYKNTLTVGMGSKQIDVGVLTDDITYSVSPAYHTYIITGINAKYLDYCIQCRNKDMFTRFVKRGSRQGKTVDLKRWLTYEIPVYDLNTQEEIVDHLDRAKSIIELRQKQIQKLDELIKARFVEMFGDVQHEEKYKGIRLRELCTTVSGGTPSTKFPEYYKGDIPWISTVSLGTNHIDGTAAKGYITQEAIDNSATKLIPAGNILFGTRVGVGKSSLNDVDICTNQDIVAIIGINESKFNRLFIKHVLDAYQPYFDSIKKGATILGISADDLKDTLIPDAPIEVQIEFVSLVEQVNKSKVAVQKMIDEAQTLFDSLMQEYFG